jgi:hypothetical protein
MKLVEIEPLTLVQNMDLYPREHGVDDEHVASLVRTLRMGETLPPPIVDEHTLEIIDGWHRTRAHVATFGPGRKITVEMHSYASHLERLKAAIHVNAIQGKKLQAQDVTRCAILLREFKVPQIETARVLATTPDYIERRLKLTVVVQGERKPAKPIALGRKYGPREISREQYGVMKRADGTPPQFTLRTLIDALRTGLIEVTPEVERLLLELRSEIDRLIGEQAA